MEFAQGHTATTGIQTNSNLEDLVLFYLIFIEL